MSEPNPGTRSFETRLGEMERRLAEIQQELAPDVPPPSVPEPEPDSAVSRSAPVEVSAGPFASLEALRAFERAVAELPGVREVTVRGYESGNRAILEVQLHQWSRTHGAGHQETP